MTGIAKRIEAEWDTTIQRLTGHHPSDPSQQEEHMTEQQQQAAPQPAPQQAVADVIGSMHALAQDLDNNPLIKSLAAHGLGKHLDQGDLNTVLNLVSRLER